MNLKKYRYEKYMHNEVFILTTLTFLPPIATSFLIEPYFGAVSAAIFALAMGTWKIMFTSKRRLTLEEFRHDYGIKESEVSDGFITGLQPNTSRKFYKNWETKEVWEIRCENDGELTLTKHGTSQTIENEQSEEETIQSNNDQLWQNLQENPKVGFVVESGRMTSTGSSGATFIGHNSTRDVSDYRSTSGVGNSKRLRA